MSVQAIREALVNHIDTLAYSPLPDIVKPKEPYKPVIGQRYLELVFQPNETVSPFVGSNDPHQQQGFLQVTLVAPRLGGADDDWALMDAVINHYRKGTILRNSGETVKIIRQPWVSPPFSDEGWDRTPISIPYFAMTY